MAREFPRRNLFEHRQPGGAYFLSAIAAEPGNVFFIDSTHPAAADSVGGGRSPDLPLATIDFAIGLCGANQGDRIYVMPGHNEGLGNAQITVDVAGISIIGLGRGASVPRIDFDHANASIDVTADGCTLSNLRLLPSVTDVLVGIDVNAAVKDTILEDIEVLPGEDGAGVDEFARAIDIKAGCTRTRVFRFRHRQHASAAGVIAPVSLTGASDDVEISDADIVALGAGVLAPISGITTLSTNVRIRRCVLHTDAEPGIELLTGTTGVIADNSIFSNLATIAAAIVADGCALFRNEYVEAGGERGALIGTASVDD